MISREELMENLPSKAVIDAIDRKGGGTPVVASDVATTAGVSLSQARKDLTALASLSRGDIAVSKDGGSFTIANVPPGKYKLKAKHRKAGEVTQDIEVTDSGATVNIELAIK